MWRIASSCHAVAIISFSFGLLFLCFSLADDRLASPSDLSFSKLIAGQRIAIRLPVV